MAASPGNPKTVRQPTPFGTLYLTIKEVGGEPIEVNMTMGRGWSDTQMTLQALSVTISQLLRTPSIILKRESLGVLAQHLRGIGKTDTPTDEVGLTRSIPDAIGKAIQDYLAGLTLSPEDVHENGDICPDCKEPALYMSEGCMTCGKCGWSQC